MDVWLAPVEAADSFCADLPQFWTARIYHAPSHHRLLHISVHARRPGHDRDVLRHRARLQPVRCPGSAPAARPRARPARLLWGADSPVLVISVAAAAGTYVQRLLVRS